MAYADKSTDMRRCCIAINGHVEWEGVRIDDEFVLRKRTGLGEFESVLNMTKDEMIETINDFNNDWQNEENHRVMKLLHQDGEDCNWNVKQEFVQDATDETERKQ